jgi:hypothetical protein
MEITNTFAFFGYVCIFLDRFRYALTSKFNASLVILVSGLFTFIVYYYNEICDGTDYARQLRTRQIAHAMFIIYILTAVFIARKFKIYYLVAFIAHALFLYNVSTNTNQLTAHVSMSAYFALIFANTINGDYSGMLVLGQIMLIVFYAVGAYKLIIQEQPSSVLDKINPTIVKCPVKNADKTDTTQERVKQ